MSRVCAAQETADTEGGTTCRICRSWGYVSGRAGRRNGVLFGKARVKLVCILTNGKILVPGKT